MDKRLEEVRIGCPYCGRHLVIDETMLGAELECPTCNQSFLAVQPESQTDQTIAGDDVSFETEATDSSETETSATAETENEPSDASEPQSLSPPKDSESRKASQKVSFRAKVGKGLSMLRTMLSSAWIRAKTSFLRLPKRAQGAVLASVVFLVGIAIFSGKGELRTSKSTLSKKTAASTSDVSSEHLKTASSRPSSRSSVPNPTESEKMAMGRVFYVYAKQEILMSQLASQGRNEGEAAAAQFLAALGGGGIMTEVDTEGCPQDFADAWKEFVAGAAGLKIVESGYNFMVAAVRHAQQNGQYVDWDTRKKLAEMEQKLPGARKECMDKMEAFAVVCRKYGLENLQQWSLDAYRRHEGDPNAKLFKSDRNRSD